MLDTNTKFDNEMIEKNTKIEVEIRELKNQLKPDDEIEQLTTLMAGKNKSYARTVNGTVPRTNKHTICEVCRLICETDKKYQNHIKSHNSNGDWRCNKCDFQTNSKTNLETHVSRFVHEIHDERATGTHEKIVHKPRNTTKTPHLRKLAVQI